MQSEILVVGTELVVHPEEGMSQGSAKHGGVGCGQQATCIDRREGGDGD